MKYKLLILTVLLMLKLHIAYTQIDYVDRVQFTLKEDISETTVHSIGESGFIVEINQGKEKGKWNWQYRIYDRDLKVKKEFDFNTSKDKFHVMSFENDQVLYSLFYSGSGEYTLVIIGVDGEMFNELIGQLPNKSRITDMEVLGNHVFIQGESIKNGVFLSNVDLNTGKSNYIELEVAGEKSKNIQLINILAVDNADEVIEFVRVDQDNKSSDAYLFFMNEEGNVTGKIKIDKNENKNIISLNAEKMNDGSYIFSGSYSGNKEDKAEGIFYCKATGNSVDYISYNEFNEFNNIMESFPFTQSEVNYYKKKQKKGNSIPYHFGDYRIKSHPLISKHDGYILVAEMYKPDYFVKSYTRAGGTNPNDHSMSTTTISYFIGYIYATAFVIKFDLSGKMVWNQTFEMEPDIRKFALVDYINLTELNENEIELKYGSKDKIIYHKINDKGEILENRESEEIQVPGLVANPSENLAGVAYWYDDNFLAFPTQAPLHKKNKKPVNKFFLIKAKYDDE